MNEITSEDIGTMVAVSQDGKNWARRKLLGVFPPDVDGGQYLAVGDNGKYFLWNMAKSEPYHLAHRDCGLKVGDWVRVTRNAASGEDGWENVWAPEMDQFIGGIHCIKADCGSDGFVLSGTGFCFPCFVLEKVSTRQACKSDRGRTVFCDGEQAILEAIFYQWNTGAGYAVVTIDGHLKVVNGHLVTVPLPGREE